MCSSYSRHFIKNYSERLRLEGFTVYNVIEVENNQPPVINGIKPEIYAKDGNLERVIIVRDNNMYNGNSDELKKLKEYTVIHPEISYWGFTIGEDGQWRLEENLI
jgi:hypothetical protein